MWLHNWSNNVPRILWHQEPLLENPGQGKKWGKSVFSLMFFEVNLLTPSPAFSPVLASISWRALTDSDCSRTKLQTQRSGGTYCKNKLNSARMDQQNRWNRMKSVLEHVFILIFVSILNVYSFVFEVDTILLYESNINPFLMNWQHSHFTFLELYSSQ